jgi:hypothetical protein
MCRTYQAATFADFARAIAHDSLVVLDVSRDDERAEAGIDAAPHIRDLHSRSQHGPL